MKKSVLTRARLRLSRCIEGIRNIQIMLDKRAVLSSICKVGLHRMHLMHRDSRVKRQENNSEGIDS